MSKGNSLKNDGRDIGNYASRYPKDVQKRLRLEAAYVFLVFIIGNILLLLNYLGLFESFLNLSDDRAIIFRKVMYCGFSALIGGATFGLKYFYRVVARGEWNEDRIFWRIFSPWIGASLSIATAAIMIDDISASSSLAVVLGYIAGYFSDEVAGKLYDVANVLFISPKPPKHEEKNCPNCPFACVEKRGKCDGMDCK